MKKYVLPLALVTATALTACNEKQDSTQDAAKAPAAAESKSDVSLESTEQRLSYGIAFGLGQRMSIDGMSVDVDAFTAGLRDGVEGKEGRMTQEEIQSELLAYREKVEAEAKAAMEAAAQENAAAGAAFLAANAEREGVIVTDSGLQYEVLEEGEGPIPGAGDTVDVNYRGTLIDGTEFDSSYKYNQSVQFGVSQVIPGWTEALQLMPVGSKWKVFIPSDLAYGAGGAGNLIGPNSALVFEVELLDIVDKDAAEAPQE